MRRFLGGPCPSLVEYALISALIAVTLILVLNLVGHGAADLGKIAQSLNN